MKIRVEYLGFVSEEVEVDSMIKDAVAKTLIGDVIKMAIKKIRESGLPAYSVDTTIAGMVSSLLDDPTQFKIIQH